MPIYEYKCNLCGHYMDALQGINDAPLEKCPECSEKELQRMISAPNFRLSGDGWYETDFKTGAKKNIVDAKDDKASKPKETKKITDTSPSSGTEK